MADVAAAAGVSTSTASRALSNSTHRVNEETRQEIRDAAARLGYKVNPIARALRRSITGTVGMVLPTLDNPFFTELVQAVEHELAERKLNLFLSDSRDDVEVEARRLRGFTGGAVDGILISPCRANGSRNAVLAAAEVVPVVQLDRRVEGVGCPWVGIDDASAMELVFEHLEDRGVKVCALVSATVSNSSALDRIVNARLAADLHSITVPERMFFDGEFSVEWGREAVDQLLSLGLPLPDAVVCTDDMLALGVMAQLRRRGIRVPEDVLVTGFDDIAFASLVDPELTTIRQPVKEIAAKAVALLSQPEEVVVSRTLFPGELIARRSSDPAG